MQILRFLTPGLTLLTASANVFAQIPKASDGPFGAIPSGWGVIEGGDIPYRLEARAKCQENRTSPWTNEPHAGCREYRGKMT